MLADGLQASPASMHVCLAYDCLYPWTVGGAERWYRGLAEELVAAGHEVTYLTRLQWEPGAPPRLPGIRVVPVSPREPLYTDEGRRRVGEALRFGWGVLAHLLRHRRAYDAVHLCSFPYFPLLAARAALAGTGRRVFVDWIEVWTRSYWREYLGPLGGPIGWAVQRLCVLVTRDAFVFSRLHERRLRQEGFRGPATVLTGLYDGPTDAVGDAAPNEPLVVFAGRHIPEKRAHLVPEAVARARVAGVPELRGLVLGDGPERDRVIAAIPALGLERFVEAPGFVGTEQVRDALRRASCLILPSVREGYGLVVIEAAACGTPSVVSPGRDNAAVELVHDGVNGFVATGDGATELGDAVARVVEAGPALRERTLRWFEENVPRLSLRASARSALERYASARS
jgi:glycosyltransferase involved in cell wall biosynthesis